jgi:hypothetical protein
MARHRLWFVLSALGLLALFCAVGCGGDSTAADSTVEIATGGSEPDDLAMATDVQRYFQHNASLATWYNEIDSIGVEGGVITVNTTLDLAEPSGRTAADQICGLIQGSDVADFTPGHTVRGQGEPIVCPCRRPVGSDPSLDDDSQADDVCRLD